MAVHIGLLIYICVLGYIFFKNGVSKSGNRYFVIVSFIAIFLIQPMRGLDVGADTPAYIQLGIAKLGKGICSLKQDNRNNNR